MDYHRIYREFIADRKSRPEPSGYTERHHILPRYKGGDDHPKNLINLTPEDHFFAHLCWAMAEGDMQAWAGVMLMHERGPRCDLFKKKTRESYGWARRRYGRLCQDAMKGQRNPNYKADVINLKKADGPIVARTRLEWFGAGIPHAALCGLMTGKSASYKGWMLPSRDPRHTGRSWAGRKRRNNKSYQWVHVNGTEREATLHELAEEFGLRSNDLTAVIRGAHGICEGWSLKGTKVGWPCGRTSFYCDKISRLVHIDGRSATGTQRDLVRGIGIDQRDLNGIVSGRRKSAQGWMLEEVANSGYRPRNWRRFSGTVESTQA